MLKHFLLYAKTKMQHNIAGIFLFLNIRPRDKYLCEA